MSSIIACSSPPLTPLTSRGVVSSSTSPIDRATARGAGCGALRRRALRRGALRRGALRRGALWRVALRRRAERGGEDVQAGPVYAVGQQRQLHQRAAQLGQLGPERLLDGSAGQI